MDRSSVSALDFFKKFSPDLTTNFMDSGLKSLLIDCFYCFCGLLTLFVLFVFSTSISTVQYVSVTSYYPLNVVFYYCGIPLSDNMHFVSCFNYG